jgi:hypothetical protein
MTGITSTDTRIWAQTEAYERLAGRQDFGRNPSCSYVKPVVTRGSTVIQ